MDEVSIRTFVVGSASGKVMTRGVSLALVSADILHTVEHSQRLPANGSHLNLTDAILSLQKRHIYSLMIGFTKVFVK